MSPTIEDDYQRFRHLVHDTLRKLINLMASTPTKDRWLVDQVENGGIHVIPKGDLIEHEDWDCPCVPSTEAVHRPDGSNGWLVVHHSLDGRERRE